MTADSQNQDQPKKLTRSSIVACGVLFLVLIPLVLLFVFNVGYIQGEEFSPDDFSQRRFEYNHIFWLNWTIKGNKHTDTTTVVAQYLVDNNLITVRSPPRQWDLLRDSRTTGDTADFDARILTDYLQQQSDGNGFFWLNWSMDHPTYAAIYWPVVADLARTYCYLGIHEIMQWASEYDVSKGSKVNFNAQLKLLASQQCLLLGEIDVEANRNQRAVLRLTLSIGYHDTVAARLARANAYNALEQSSLAEKDLAVAESLKAQTN